MPRLNVVSLCWTLDFKSLFFFFWLNAAAASAAGNNTTRGERLNQNNKVRAIKPNEQKDAKMLSKAWRELQSHMTSPFRPLEQLLSHDAFNPFILLLSFSYFLVSQHLWWLNAALPLWTKHLTKCFALLYLLFFFFEWLKATVLHSTCWCF